MLRKTYDGTVVDDYSIYDRIKQEGNYITNRATKYDYNFMFWDRLSKAPARSLMVLGSLATGGLALLFGLGIPAAAIGAGVLALTTNGVVSLIKAIVGGLKKKWGPDGYKARRNAARDTFAQNYLERRKQGKTSKKEDKMFEKMTGKVAINEHFMADADTMKRGVNANALNFERQEVINKVFANEQMAETGRTYPVSGVKAFESFSKLSEGGYVDSKTKKNCYEYKHFNNSQNCVEINLAEEAGTGVTINGATVKCVKATVNELGAIDLSKTENAEILKHPDLVLEIVKQYPEVVATLPKQFVKDNFGEIRHDGTVFKQYNESGAELDVADATEAAQIAYFNEFKKAYVIGVDARAGTYISGETQIIDHITGERSDVAKKGKDYAKAMGDLFNAYLTNRESTTASNMGRGF